jgi:hypothetical protein
VAIWDLLEGHLSSAGGAKCGKNAWSIHSTALNSATSAFVGLPQWWPPWNHRPDHAKGPLHSKGRYDYERKILIAVLLTELKNRSNWSVQGYRDGHKVVTCSFNGAMYNSKTNELHSSMHQQENWKD